MMENKVRLPLLASNNFDISLFEIFFPLLSGGQADMIEHSSLKDVSIIVDRLKNLNSFHAVPALMEQIIDSIENQNIHSNYNHIQKVFVGGEAVSTALLHKIKKTFINSDINVLYGPTETTIFTTTKQIKNDIPQTNSYILGTPILDTGILILDDYLKMIPVGVIGKIYISGAGLAKGYLNKPELTDLKFIRNPYKKDEKIYDSGDLGRWLPDGGIEFLGRSDNQVKIRGFRIELGEIESVLTTYSEIRQVIVQAKDVNNQKVLVAYYISEEEINKADLRLYLMKKIPEYMIPGFYVKMEKFPVTPNGKIDHKSLPDITDSDIIKKEYVAPQNSTQTKLVEIWENVLGINKIGINDNFFELGGHSINIIKIVAEIQKDFEIKINITDLFKDSTIKALEDLINNQIWYNQDLPSDSVSDKITI